METISSDNRKVYELLNVLYKYITYDLPEDFEERLYNSDLPLFGDNMIYARISIGLCCNVKKLMENNLITPFEDIVLISFLRDNKPSIYQYQDFYNHKSFLKESLYWWDNYSKTQEGHKQRILFIKYLLERNKTTIYSVE